MDFLEFNPNFRVLICTRCKFALAPGTVGSHLSNLHKDQVTLSERRDCIALWANKPIQPAEVIQQLDVPEDAPPVPKLALHSNGVCCLLCQEQAYICGSVRSMQDHLKKAHAWTSRCKAGRPSKADIAKGRATAFPTVTLSPVWYQTFHVSNFRRNFRVAAPLELDEGRPSRAVPLPPASLEAQVELQLTEKMRVSDEAASTVLQLPPEQSAWLQTTEWVRYLQGHDLGAAAWLIALPHSSSKPEPDLIAILDSFDKLVEQARKSVKQGKINAFDQQRINSFLRSGSRTSKASDRPLAHRLKEGTYRTYKKTWKQLLCFVFRMVYQGQQPALHCLLTSAQSAAIDELACAARTFVRQQELLDASKESRDRAPREDQMQSLQRTLDSACLRFSIALLNHRLMGDIFDSVVVGFLAVLGINSTRDGFQEATTYTPHLSALIKIAQMLILQRAVAAVDDGETEYPSQMIDDMQDRFMAYGSRSPINWAQKLRVYGKKIRDSTTSLGYMVWSEDRQKLTYRDLELSMSGLKQFARWQVEAAQEQLQQLLLIHAEEAREDVVPKLRLQDLKDNPALNQVGQSFLTDPRNPGLQGYDRWLLNRVLKYDWLQDEFLIDVKKAIWRPRAVEHYIGQVDSFLEQLLLLILMTSGQPARGTELTSLQYCNSAHGRRRNIFVENGLVTFVTFCHKGYSITNSTKVIHRYLPQEVSELLVYYLWLVLPFCRQLKLLALNSKELASPYLWAAKELQEPLLLHGKKATRLPHWDSSRLSKVLQQEFKAYLNTTANITLWRHAAIAISRKHLGGLKFKRDYGSEPAPTWAAEQTGHTANVAGNVYARGIEEAPGHVELARTEYRALSRTWHSFLGFGAYLGVLPPNSLKRPRDESRRGMKDRDVNLSSCIREDEVDLEAEIQRRVEIEVEAEVERRVKGALLQMSDSRSQQVKRRKTNKTGAR
ncbi:hypothetical protein ACLOAV_010150 [Pseudogymnoascus australis]